MNGEIMVNATEMARPFGRETKFWLRSVNATDFIDALAKVRNCHLSDLVIVKNGSPANGGGTWFHRDVAIEFARWLAPAFAIWCNDRINNQHDHNIE